MILKIKLPYFSRKLKERRMKKLHENNAKTTPKKGESNLIKMVRTRLLVKAYEFYDLHIKPNGAGYMNHLVPWEGKGDALSQLFHQKITEERRRIKVNKLTIEDVLRRFFVKSYTEKNLCPLDFFESFQESDLGKLSCSALAIVTHFAISIEEGIKMRKTMLGEENYYLWDLTPEREANKVLKIVNIIKNPDYLDKYSLFEYDLTRVIPFDLDYRQLQFIVKVPDEIFKN